MKFFLMKSESLVIVNHHVTVNDLSNFAHTAHHARRVYLTGHYLLALKLHSALKKKSTIVSKLINSING